MSAQDQDRAVLVSQLEGIARRIRATPVQIEDAHVVEQAAALLRADPAQDLKERLLDEEVTAVETVAAWLRESEQSHPGPMGAPYHDLQPPQRKEPYRRRAASLLARVLPAIECELRERINALPKEDGIAHEFLRRSTIRAGLSKAPTDKASECETCGGRGTIRDPGYCGCIMEAHCDEGASGKRCRLRRFGSSGEGSPGVAAARRISCPDCTQREPDNCRWGHIVQPAGSKGVVCVGCGKEWTSKERVAGSETGCPHCADGVTCVGCGCLCHVQREEACQKGQANPKDPVEPSPASEVTEAMVAEADAAVDAAQERWPDATRAVAELGLIGGELGVEFPGDYPDGVGDGGYLATVRAALAHCTGHPSSVPDGEER